MFYYCQLDATPDARKHAEPYAKVCYSVLIAVGRSAAEGEGGTSYAVE